MPTAAGGEVLHQPPERLRRKIECRFRMRDLPLGEHGEKPPRVAHTLDGRPVVAEQRQHACARIKQVRPRFETRTCDPADAICLRTRGFERSKEKIAVDAQRRRIADRMPLVCSGTRIDIAKQIERDHTPTGALRRLRKQARR